jgi:hypothetical protein
MIKIFSGSVIGLSLLLTLLTFSSATGQNAALSGYIKDASTGETLLGANVIFLETMKGTSSNNSGFYVFSSVKPGTYTLVSTYVGYNRYEQEITLKPGDDITFDIELVPESFETEEVIITADQIEQEKQNVGRIDISTDIIKDIPSVFEADVFRSIQLLPGVKSASDFSSGLYIRGGGPDQTLILLDRTTVYNPSHFFGFFSTFNPSAIKDIQLYKGGYPAKYGGRLGSVLDIYNKDGNRNRTAGDFTVGFLASRATIEGPTNSGSYMLAVRRSTIEPILSALEGSVDGIPEAFYFYDVNGKLNYDINSDNKLSLGFYTGADYVRVPFADDAEAKLRYGNVTGSLNWTHLFSSRLFSNITLTTSHYFNEPELSLGGTPIEQENTVLDYSLRADLQYLPNDEHEIETGIWTGRNLLRFNSSFDGEETFSSRIAPMYLSAYVQDTWRPSLKWKFTGGVLTNYFSEGDFVRVDPRISVEHYLTSKTRLQLAFGGYSQFLTLITNEAFSGFDTWLTTGEGVSPAYGWQYIAGLKTQPFESYRFDVELYYRTMEDLFELDPRVPDVAGLPYSDIFRFGEGRAYGVELFLQKGMGDLTGFVGYTFGVSERKFPGVNVNPETGKERYYSPKYDRTHDIKAALTYSLTKSWDITTTFTYATGQAYTLPASRSQLISDPFTDEVGDFFTVQRVNDARLPAYHRMDIGATYKHSFFGVGDAELQIQVINVYNRSNVWFYQYDFNENPIDRSAINLLPTIPNLSYSVTF